MDQPGGRLTDAAPPVIRDRRLLDDESPTRSRGVMIMPPRWPIVLHRDPIVDSAPAGSQPAWIARCGPGVSLGDRPWSSGVVVVVDEVVVVEPSVGRVVVVGARVVDVVDADVVDVVEEPGGCAVVVVDDVGRESTTSPYMLRVPHGPRCARRAPSPRLLRPDRRGRPGRWRGCPRGIRSPGTTRHRGRSWPCHGQPRARRPWSPGGRSTGTATGSRCSSCSPTGRPRPGSKVQPKRDRWPQ